MKLLSNIYKICNKTIHSNLAFALADNAWSKKVAGTTNTYELWINETKLSEGTSLTRRQGELVTAAGNSSDITVRSLDKGGFKKGDKIIIKGIIKTNGNGTVSNFHDIKKIQL